MTSQPGKQAITIHTLPNISRGNGNQTMKFGHLKGFNMRNVFIKKSYKKCGGEIRPRPLPEKLKFSISLDQHYKVLCRLLLLCAKFRAIELNRN